MKCKMLGLLAIAALRLCPGAGAQIYDTNNDVVETFAGSGFSGLVNGQGTQTMFNWPCAVVADSSGNLFVADSTNGLIRKITPGATVSTFASFSGEPTYALAIDHSNTLYTLVPGGFSMLMFSIAPSGSVSSISLPSFYYVGWPGGLCVDSSNNVYISYPMENLIYRYRPGFGFAVFAGSGNFGEVDGTGIFSSFISPGALAADAADNIYVADDFGRSIRRIDQNQNVTSPVGVSPPLDVDGQNPSFASVSGMCVDPSGNLILACGSCVRKMSVTTNAVTLAGEFPTAYDPGTGYSNGLGSNALFNSASGVCFSQGMIFVADSGNERIRSITNNPQPQVLSAGNLALATYPGLTISGVVGRTYQVQRSPDMNSWTTVSTLVLTSSPFLWIDQNPVVGNKFYRAFLLP
jgi:hypothetical protein